MLALVGNKSDLVDNREVSHQEGEQLADDIAAKFFVETSARDGGNAEVGFSAKTGVSAPVAEKLDLYGEVSFAKYEDIDAGYGLKLGGKFVF